MDRGLHRGKQTHRLRAILDEVCRVAVPSTLHGAYASPFASVAWKSIPDVAIAPGWPAERSHSICCLYIRVGFTVQTRPGCFQGQLFPRIMRHIYPPSDSVTPDAQEPPRGEQTRPEKGYVVGHTRVRNTGLSWEDAGRRSVLFLDRECESREARCYCAIARLG